MMWGVVAFELAVCTVLMPIVTWLWWDGSINAQAVDCRREGKDLILQVELVQRLRRNRVCEFRYDGECWTTLDGKRIWSPRIRFELRAIFVDLLWEAAVINMLANGPAAGEA